MSAGTSATSSATDGTAGSGPRRSLSDPPEGRERLLELRKQARRLVRDDGATFGREQGGTARSWRLDPLPLVLAAGEWAGLERGLRQRGELLRLLLEDLYGPRRLLRERVLPAAAVFAHSGYIRAARPVPEAGRRLLFWASDVARRTDGEWTVLSDRTQLPSGAGYAVVARRIVSRLLPGRSRQARLASPLVFFHELAGALAKAAPEPDGPPRLALLSAGVCAQSAFDEAFTASLLGAPLVQAEDLVVRAGTVRLRGSRGESRVDVVARCADDRFSDPLEMRGDGRPGVPGLLEAARTRRVAVVNPIGATALENPALAAYAAPIARSLLGEELLLHPPQSWWCGDPGHLAHVLARLEFLLLAPTSGRSGRRPIAGWQLTSGQRERLRDRIRTEPWAWAARQLPELEETSVVEADGLQTRRFSLRVFATRREGETVLMRGGLARAAADAQETSVMADHASLAKDVWVPEAREQSSPDSVTVAAGTPRPPGGELFEMTPRSAGELFRLGREAERADHATRLLAAVADAGASHAGHPGTPGAAALTRLMAAHPGLAGTDPAHAQAVMGEIRDTLLDTERSGSVAAGVRRLVGAAQRVRELLSGEVWPVLAGLERTLEGAAAGAVGEDPLSGFESLRSGLLALQGVVAHGMFRDASWAFIDLGMRMERAAATGTLLRATLLEPAPALVEQLLMERVLQVCDSTVSHRRRAAWTTGPLAQLEAALELLLVDHANPRSIGFQLRRAASDLRAIGQDGPAGEAAALADRLSWLDVGAAAEERGLLADELELLGHGLAGLEGELRSRCFPARAPQQAAPQEEWSRQEHGA